MTNNELINFTDDLLLLQYSFRFFLYKVFYTCSSSPRTYEWIPYLWTTQLSTDRPTYLLTYLLTFHHSFLLSLSSTSLFRPRTSGPMSETWEGVLYNSVTPQNLLPVPYRIKCKNLLVISTRLPPYQPFVYQLFSLRLSDQFTLNVVTTTELDPTITILFNLDKIYRVPFPRIFHMTTWNTPQFPTRLFFILSTDPSKTKPVTIHYHNSKWFHLFFPYTPL